MAKKIMSFSAYFFLFTGTIIVIISSAIYSLLNAELTQAEVFLNNWYWDLLGFILVIGGLKLFPIETNSNGYTE